MSHSQEAAFLQAIQADPKAATPRLIYADWLEEQGDPRADYLRLELQLAKLKRTELEAKKLRKEILQLRSQLDEKWLTEFEQPRMMLANLTPYKAAWPVHSHVDWTIPDVPPKESYDSSNRIPYEQLPPVPTDKFNGSFEWLERSVDVPSEHEQSEYKQKAIGSVMRLSKEAEQLGLTLPATYLTFMKTPALFLRLRTTYDYYWPYKLVQSPLGEGAYLLRFMTETICYWNWYLYLHPSKYHAIVTSSNMYGGYVCEEEDDDDTDEITDEGEDAIQFGAPSFECFIYRVWMEAKISISLMHHYNPLTSEEEDYMKHYKNGPQIVSNWRAKYPVNTRK